MDFKFLFDGIFYSTLVTILFPLTCLLIVLNLQPPSFKWLTVILLFSMSCDLGALLLIGLKLNPNPANNFHTLINPLFLSFFYFHSIQRRSLVRPLVIANLLMFIFSLLNMLYIQKTTFNSFSTIPECLLILSLSISYYYKLLKDLPTKKIQGIPLFWVISAFSLTTAGKLILYSFRDYLINTVNDNLIFLWSLHNLLSVLGNLLIGWGAWLQYKQLKLKHGLAHKL